MKLFRVVLSTQRTDYIVTNDQAQNSNHIGCVILVWVRLKQVTFETAKTIYQVKHGLLSDYLRQHLKSPAVKMIFA